MSWYFCYLLGQAKEVGLSKLVPDVLRLIDDDKQAEVREAAMEVFVAGYRCFGNRLQTDLLKRNPKRMNQILAKLQDITPDSRATSMSTPSR